MFTPKTYEDLFGGVAEALLFYKNIFPQDTTPQPELEATINIAYIKIDPVFGEFRDYAVGEDTKRNYDVKTAVCFEANSIIKANIGATGQNIGNLNTSTGGTGVIKSEKMEDVSVTYSDGGTGGSIGLGDSSLKDVLGLISVGAAVLLSRYIRKTYGWGTPSPCVANINTFSCK